MNGEETGRDFAMPWGIGNPRLWSSVKHGPDSVHGNLTQGDAQGLLRHRLGSDVTVNDVEIEQTNALHDETIRWHFGSDHRQSAGVEIAPGGKLRRAQPLWFCSLLP